MGLSSNSLIHLTNKKSALKGILTDNFRVKYCAEEIEIRGAKTIRGAFPMVCFCDIPLSEIKNHIEKYGHYGIGLKKSWSEKKSLNPVLYIERNSTLGERVHHVISTLLKGKKISDTDETVTALADLARYMKNYEGDLTRKGKIIKNYRFSDEREWRYVLPPSEGRIMYTMSDYNKPGKKAIINDNIKDKRLTFELNDINYIIVKKEDEISEIIALLKKVKGKYSLDEVDRLMTRIITTEQIIHDF